MLLDTDRVLGTVILLWWIDGVCEKNDDIVLYFIQLQWYTDIVLGGTTSLLLKVEVYVKKKWRWVYIICSALTIYKTAPLTIN